MTKVGDLVRARSGQYSLFLKDHENNTVSRRKVISGEVGVIIKMYKDDTCAYVFLQKEQKIVYGSIAPWKVIS